MSQGSTRGLQSQSAQPGLLVIGVFVAVAIIVVGFRSRKGCRHAVADASVNGIWQRLALSMILLFALTIPGAVLLFRPLAAPSRSEPPATSR